MAATAFLGGLRRTRPLHLLYVDGMGAAKSHIGTLDFQDSLLLDTRTADNPLASERERADGLCALCGGWGLDGVVRMEAGFEVIKCDFAVGMEEVRVRTLLNIGSDELSERRLGPCISSLFTFELSKWCSTCEGECCIVASIFIAVLASVLTCLLAYFIALEFAANCAH